MKVNFLVPVVATIDHSPANFRMRVTTAATKTTAVVAAMNAHAAETKVQEHGCAVLENIISVSEARTDAAVSAGGVQAVVAAMDAHVGVASVQMCGRCVLKKIERYKRYADKNDERER